MNGRRVEVGDSSIEVQSITGCGAPRLCVAEPGSAQRVWYRGCRRRDRKGGARREQRTRRRWAHRARDGHGVRPSTGPRARPRRMWSRRRRALIGDPALQVAERYLTSTSPPVARMTGSFRVRGWAAGRGDLTSWRAAPKRLDHGWPPDTWWRDQQRARPSGGGRDTLLGAENSWVRRAMPVGESTAAARQGPIALAGRWSLDGAGAAAVNSPAEGGGATVEPIFCSRSRAGTRRRYPGDRARRRRARWIAS